MLFGHQNNNSDQAASGSTPAPADGVNPLAVDPATGASLPAAPLPPPADDSAKPDESASALNQPMPAAIDAPAATVPDFSASSSSSSDSTTSNSTPTEAPASDAGTSPVTDSSDESASTSDTPPIIPEPTPAEEPSAPSVPADLPTLPVADSDAPAAGSVPADDLLSLKQEALSQLSPLVDKLDQTPEEKFRTTMMLIQSTDDPSRIPEAYKAAQEITDEKIRAQALLDVVNEINYFTQSAKSAE